MDSISNTQLENSLLSSRLKLALVFISLLTLLLLTRLYNLQVINHEYYQEESLGNQMRTLPITPSRGKIFDRNGKFWPPMNSLISSLSPLKKLNISVKL